MSRQILGLLATLWSLAFGAPHTVWALGVSYGYPGGAANYERWMTSDWRAAYNILVVLLSIVGAIVAYMLRRPSQHQRLLRRLSGTAGFVLTLRGAAGMAVDRTSDLVWWPTFLLGGILFVCLTVASATPSTAPTSLSGPNPETK